MTIDEYEKALAAAESKIDALCDEIRELRCVILQYWGIVESARVGVSTIRDRLASGDFVSAAEYANSMLGLDS